MATYLSQAVRIKTVVTQDGELHLEGPFRAGDTVEVIVLNEEAGPEHVDRYPLRGMPVLYTDPFESVAADEWDATG